MDQLNEVLEKLETRHRLALKWFADHAGAEHGWPKPLSLPDETLLASKAKGIYKPQWSPYALSVRESLGGPYPDRMPVLRQDGTWFYSYFQENIDPGARDLEYTNRALLECWRDKVPIGVIRQTKGKPRVRYHILGLALIGNWEGGYFYLEGFSAQGLSHGRGPTAQLELVLDRVQRAEELLPEASDVAAGRERIFSAIARRRGSVELRRRLLAAYEGRCAMSGCDLADVLEPARIVPLRRTTAEEATNALLLRSDLHTAFNLGLVAVDTSSMNLLLAPRLLQSSYQEFLGRRLRLPAAEPLRPSREALDVHRAWSGL